MDPKVFHDKWNALQPKIKQKWSKFTDQDLKQINGEKTKFLSELQKKYGVDKNIAEQELKKMTETLAGVGAETSSHKSNSPKANPMNSNSKMPHKK